MTKSDLKTDPIMKGYVLDLRTEMDLGSKHFVTSLLNEWSEKLDVRLRPERFGLGEPVRRSLADEGINAAIDLWLAKRMPVMLKRVKQPKFLANISWRADKGADKRPFPWSCTVWLNSSAGDTHALTLMRFLISHFKPAFASISSDDERRSKHFSISQDWRGRVEKYLGLDVGNTLPGVYWLTYFGPWSLKRLGGRDKVMSLEGVDLLPMDDGIGVMAFESCRDWSTSPAQQSVKRIIGSLGEGNFFDRSREGDTGGLPPSNWCSPLQLVGTGSVLGFNIDHVEFGSDGGPSWNPRMAPPSTLLE